MSIPENFKQSLIVAKQLPDFIHDDESYYTFIRFIEAYYEWLETQYQLYDRSKNLLNYKDIDNTLDEFEEYFYNEFLQFFPSDSLTNKKELVKLSKEFYQRKGTEASFKFLFRALYNSECETFHTRKMLFIPSSGKWIISKSIRINTLDDRFLQIAHYKIIGETSKSIAKIERSQYSGNKIEIFLSDIQRKFSSGEYIRVVDNEYNDILIDGENLRAKIIGLVPAIYIDNISKGLNYNSGDPVIIYGGLNPEIDNPTEATAIVGDVTDGSVDSITILNSGYGYTTYPNTIISIISNTGSGANAQIVQIDNTTPILISNVSPDIILPYSNVILSDSFIFPVGIVNANTIINEALTTITIETFPIKEIKLNSGGSGYKSTPILDIQSYATVNSNTYSIKSFGICSPIKINFSGYNYSNGDIINLVGGSGSGAKANVKLVDANGSILQTQYIQYENGIFPYGGAGYNNLNLPTVTVNSANNKIFNLITNNVSNSNTNVLYFANTTDVKIGMFVYGNNIIYDKTFNYFQSNTIVITKNSNSITLSNPIKSQTNVGDSYEFNGTAVLTVPSILGDSASIDISINSIGEILSLILTSTGEDYIEQPSVSLKVMDIVVYGINELYLPQNGDIIYQGNALYPQFTAIVHSIVKIPYELLDLFYIRVYNYNGTLNTDDELYIDKTTKNSREIILYIDKTYNKLPYTNGIKLYGDGNAKANVSFVSGTITSNGQYMNSDGFPSSYCKLQGQIYNDFTYILSVEKALSVYKNVINNILHPSGTQMVSRNIIKSEHEIDVLSQSYYNNTSDIHSYVNSDVYAQIILPMVYWLLTEIDDPILSEDDDELNTTLYDEFALVHDSLSNIFYILTEDGYTLTLDDGTLLTTIIGDSQDELIEFDIEDEEYSFAATKIYINNLKNVKLDNVVFQNCMIQLISNNNETVCSKVLSVKANTSNVIYIETPVILQYSNVAYGYSNGNNIIISSLTGNFDLINNGKYKNDDHLKDIVYINDYIQISNNTFSITNIDYNNRILYTNNNINYGNASQPKLINIIRNFYSNNITIKYENGQEVLL